MSSWPSDFSSTLVKVKMPRTRAPAGTGARGQEADPVETVIDGHLHIVRHQHDVSGEAAEQRQGQEAVSDRAAEHRFLGRVRVDVDKLPVLGDVGEFIDALLVDGHPVRSADLGADAGVDFLKGGDGHGVAV
jgi:hypothetical protein